MQYMKTLEPLLLVTLLTLVAGPAAAPPSQITAPPWVQAPRDPTGQQPPAVGTGSISGVVTVAGSGQPARKVRVRLSGAELRGGRSLTTDDQGRFNFASLPAGRFTLSASKPGHVMVSYGQRQPGPGRPGTAIQLADSQRIEVQLQIPRGGVITGTVLDEHGEAIPGTAVRVLRYSMQSGRRTLQPAGNGSTDDRGVYRVYGLQPGDYVVAATPRNTSNAELGDRIRSEVLEMRRAAATLGASRAAEARQILERVESMQTQIPAQDEPVAGNAPV
jgi:protocatechuate 3,4-dioxygenase beta subunit